jgi:hypothetical protein
MKATTDEKGLLSFDGTTNQACDLALLLLRFANGKSGPLSPRPEAESIKIETAFLRALRECEHPSALAARISLNEIPRPLWDKILDATSAVVGRADAVDPLPGSGPRR